MVTHWTFFIDYSVVVAKIPLISIETRFSAEFLYIGMESL